MELTAAEIWYRILERARHVLPVQYFRSWLDKTRAIALTDDVLTIWVPSEFAALWIDDKYGGRLAEVAEAVCGRRLKIAFQHFPACRPGTGRQSR
jgi:chromosomal replication initiation ATPase DnaA